MIASVEVILRTRAVPGNERIDSAGRSAYRVAQIRHISRGGVASLAAITLLVALAGSTHREPPADAEVLRAIPQATRGLPFVVGEFRDDVVIVKNLLKQKTVGAQVESQWECVAYYTRTIELGAPLKMPCVAVVYIDKVSATKQSRGCAFTFKTEIECCVAVNTCANLGERWYLLFGAALHAITVRVALNAPTPHFGMTPMFRRARSRLNRLLGYTFAPPSDRP